MLNMRVKIRIYDTAGTGSHRKTTRGNTAGSLDLPVCTIVNVTLIDNLVSVYGWQVNARIYATVRVLFSTKSILVHSQNVLCGNICSGFFPSGQWKCE